MESKKKRSPKKKVKAEELSNSTETQPVNQTETKQEEKTEIYQATRYQETTETREPEVRTETEGRSSFVSQKISDIKNKINYQLNMAKNMYMLFQGMKQSYGGDTKKVIAVMLGFAKEEGKRRINNLKDKIRKKIFGELD